jgi:hypothetical protein
MKNKILKLSAIVFQPALTLFNSQPSSNGGFSDLSLASFIATLENPEEDKIY